MGRYIFRIGNFSDSSNEDGQRTKLSQKVTVQALLYIVFFFLTWIFPMVQFVVANQTGNLLFPLLALTTILNPLQGFYDALIYARPRYLQYRAREAARRREGFPSRLESIVHVVTCHDDLEEVEGEIMPDAVSCPIAPSNTLNNPETSCPEATSSDGERARRVTISGSEGKADAPARKAEDEQQHDGELEQPQIPNESNPDK